MTGKQPIVLYVSPPCTRLTEPHYRFDLWKYRLSDGYHEVDWYFDPTYITYPVVAFESDLKAAMGMMERVRAGGE